MDFDIYLRFLLALIFVIGLIVAAAWLARRLGLGGNLTHKPGKQRRLAIVEVSALDNRNRLVLVRRDKVEHLILLGAQDHLLIETGIRPDRDAAASSFADALEAESRE